MLLSEEAGDADAALAAAERELQIALAEAAAAREAASARKETAARAAAEEEAPHARLVLVRHGQSEWNLANRFTGWVDVDLTEQGILEAREAGRLLAAAGLEIDEVHTSLMRRAIRSAVLMLSTLNQCWLPVRKHLELNEQHAGLLTGENKVSCAQKWGVDQVMAWRRNFEDPPPEIAADSAIQRAIATDRRYDAARVPSRECLSAVSRRVAGLWEGTIAPALQEGRTVLVVTHGNTLRALVAYLDGLAPEDVYHVDLPTATPLLYEFDADGAGAEAPVAGLRHAREHGVWGEREGAARHGRFLVDESRVRAAQQAMRQQVLQDIAYSMVTAPTEDGEIKTAFTAPEARQRLSMIEGEGYTVRQTPPAYFFQESERLEEQARSDLEEFRLSTRLLKVPGQKKRVRCALVLLRHGQSAFNHDKIFTGWADPDLTNRGREEARLAGKMLKVAGVERIAMVHTSLLKRAIKTAWLALDEMDLQWTPVQNTWRLNERNYGELQGRVKADCVKAHGLKQVQRWRRGFSDRPPPWSDATLVETIDRRYDLYRGGDFPPRSESLEDCQQRLRPFLYGELGESMRAAVDAALADAEAGGGEYEVPTVLVVASENVLRGLVMEIEGMTQEQIPLVDVPYAVPLVYQLDSALTPVATPWAEPPLRAGWYLGDPTKVRAVQAEIQADLAVEDADDEEEACLVESFDDERGESVREWRCS